jgi:hypothetical protein
VAVLDNWTLPVVIQRHSMQLGWRGIYPSKAICQLMHEWSAIEDLFQFWLLDLAERIGHLLSGCSLFQSLPSSLQYIDQLQEDKRLTKPPTRLTLRGYVLTQKAIQSYAATDSTRDEARLLGHEKHLPIDDDPLACHCYSCEYMWWFVWVFRFQVDAFWLWI